MAIIPNSKVNLATHIRDVLNSAGGSVGNDAASFFADAAKVNKWSIYKPVRYNKAFELTDTERASINYGFIIQAYTSPSAVYNAVQNGTAEWGYDKPVSGDYLRLGDFCGYDSSTSRWLNVTVNKSTVNEGDTVNFSIDGAMNLQSIINTFATYKSFVGSTKTSADFGFIIQSSSNTNASSALFYKIGAWIDTEDLLDSDKLNVTIPNISGYYTGTSFKFIPVLCSARSQSNRTLAYIRDDDAALGAWYPLSFNGVTLTVGTGSADLNNLSVYLSSSDWDWYDISNYVVQLNSVSIEIANGNSSSIALDSVTVGVTGYIGPGGPSNNDASLGYNGSKTISANSSVYSELVTTDKTYGYGYMYEVATEETIGVTVTVRKGSTTKTFNLSLSDK